MASFWTRLPNHVLLLGSYLIPVNEGSTRVTPSGARHTKDDPKVPVQPDGARPTALGRSLSRPLVAPIPAVQAYETSVGLIGVLKLSFDLAPLDDRYWVSVLSRTHVSAA